jgi:hypothetical protein
LAPTSFYLGVRKIANDGVGPSVDMLLEGISVQVSKTIDENAAKMSYFKGKSD